MATKKLTPEEEAAKVAAQEATEKAEAEAAAKAEVKQADGDKAKLAEEAARHFKNYPGCNVIYATVDENFWLEQDVQAARSYAQARNYELHEFKRQ